MSNSANRVWRFITFILAISREVAMTDGSQRSRIGLHITAPAALYVALRWRCAPAHSTPSRCSVAQGRLCGSAVVPFHAAYPALIPQHVFFENHAAGTDGARLFRAFGAFSVDSPRERVRLRV
jgi:hypothetical protein